MKKKTLNFVGIDIGSSKISAIAADIDIDSGISILSNSMHNAFGFKMGSIVDMNAAKLGITNAIYSLEKDCNKSITFVDVSLSGYSVTTSYLSEKVKLNNEQAISINEIRRLIQKMLSTVNSNRTVIHYFPLEFMLDDNIVDNPIGLLAKELNCKLYIVSVDSILLTNITNCLSKCHIEVKSFMLSTYASSIACLTEEEKSLGTMVLDIGANITALAIIYNNKLVYYDNINMGSNNLTEEIARMFSISKQTAEKLKVLYGDAIHSNIKNELLLRVEDFEPDNQYNPHLTITLTQISKIINSQMKEILLCIKNKLESTGINTAIAPRIVIIGGGSYLRSIKELATNIFGKQARIGRVNFLDSLDKEFHNNSNNIMYASIVGMMMDKLNKQQKSVNLNEIMDKGIINKIIHWIKVNM